MYGFIQYTHALNTITHAPSVCSSRSRVRIEDSLTRSIITPSPAQPAARPNAGGVSIPPMASLPTRAHEAKGVAQQPQVVPHPAALRRPPQPPSAGGYVIIPPHTVLDPETMQALKSGLFTSPASQATSAAAANSSPAAVVLSASSETLISEIAREARADPAVCRSHERACFARLARAHGLRYTVGGCLTMCYVQVSEVAGPVNTANPDGLDSLTSGDAGYTLKESFLSCEPAPLIVVCMHLRVM